MKTKQHIVTKIPILGGKCHIYRNVRSGKVWQYQQWVKDEKKYIRTSLKTTDREIATEIAEKKFADTLGRIHSGEKIFSITAKELVAQYLKHLEQRVALGSIRVTFPQIVKSHLKHYLAFVEEDTKIQSIPAEKFREYAHHRRSQTPRPGFLTVKDSQNAIGTMYRWGMEEQLITRKSLPKWAEFRIPATEGKRHGMEHDDYTKIVTVSKLWDKKGTNDRDKYERKHIHNFIVIQSWYGFRTGEVLGLVWGDVKFRNDGNAEVRIREATTKRGKARMCMVRGDIFHRIQSYSKYTSPTDHVFSSFIAGKEWKDGLFYARWRELVGEITQKYPTFDTSISLYDLRHFYISSRLRAGDSPWLIAKYCGTSAEMIGKHYDNVTDLQVSKKILSKQMKFVGDEVIGVTTQGGKDGEDE
ncbi:MAG: tyrosine-type recombinase/integrase [Nitrospirota bacterium]|nr:tyrosine-type recombinase/integrase [Nitrospirota bacterium]